MMEKTIEYNNHVIKIIVTLNGHRTIKENYNAGRFDDPYITEVNHLFECYIDGMKFSTGVGNNYDLSTQIIEDKLVKEAKERIDLLSKTIVMDNINILKSQGYKKND